VGRLYVASGTRRWYHHLGRQAEKRLFYGGFCTHSLPPVGSAHKRRERERCLAAERMRSHGELANRILGNGTTVKTEKLSYKAWQRQRYGKSTKVRSPAAFVNVLRNKISAAGGELIEFGTRNTCLSQFCHLRGTYTKKPLSQRYHQFPDGTRVGRDVYSAFLARFVLDNRLDAIQAAKAWTGAEAFLRVASNGFEPASGKGSAFPLPMRRCTTKEGANQGKSCDGNRSLLGTAVCVGQRYGF
jgi:putative transposase